MGGYRGLVLSALLELWRRWRRPVSPAEVHRYLLSRGVRLSDRRVREILYELAKRGYLDRIQVGNRTYYRPRDERLVERTVARDRSLLDFLGTPTTSEEVTARADIRDVTGGEGEQAESRLVRELLRHFTLAERISKALYREAGELARMDPADLAAEMLGELCRLFYRAAERNDQVLLERVATLLVKLTEKLYRSVYGVPVYYLGRKTAGQIAERFGKDLDVQTLCGNAPSDVLVSPVAAIAYYVTDPSREKSIYAFSRKRLLQFLRFRIVDDTLAVPVKPVEESRIVYVSGHDASYWPVKLSAEDLLGVSLGYPVDVYVLAGVIYATWRFGRGPRTDVAVEVVPNPRTYSQLDPDELLEKGYLVTPFAEGEDFGEGTRAKRIAEAAMNILEYEMLSGEISTTARPTGLILKGPKNGVRRPAYPPRPVLHDGRLYPYEHKLDDYARGYGDAHSKLVRRAFEIFREVVRSVVGDPRGPVIVGVVKRPVSPTVYPLLVYALYRRGAIDLDTLLLALDKWYLERFVVMRFLLGVYEAVGRPRGVTLRTFAVIRRLWAMDDKLARAYTRPDYGAQTPGDEFRQEFWEERVVVTADQLSEEGPGLRNYLHHMHVEDADEAAETLAYVLAKASVALAYVLPPPDHIDVAALSERARTALPRYELLVAPPDPSDVDMGDVKDYRRYVAERLRWLALPCVVIDSSVLVCYEVAEVLEGEGEVKFGTMVPTHVAYADIYVKEVDRLLRTQFAQELLTAISRAMRHQEVNSA